MTLPVLNSNRGWSSAFRRSGSASFAGGAALCLLLTLHPPGAKPAQAATLLLKAAHVHTVSGATLSPGAVLVRDGRIADVGATIDSPADQVLDLGGLHLYPGLIALDTSLGLAEIDSVRASTDRAEVGEFSPDVQSWIAVNPDSELIPVARANGITHVQVVPGGGTVAGVSGVIALTGWTTEQMVVRKPVALHVYWPGLDLDTRPKEYVRGSSKPKPLEEQAKERAQKLKSLEDFFAEAAAYARARTNSANSQLVPAWEAMLPFVRGEIPLMIHADDVRQIKSAVAWAETNHYRIMLAGARDAWQVAPLLAAKKVPVIFTHVFTLPERDIDPYDVFFKAPAVLHRAGVEFAITSGGTWNLRNLPYNASHAMAFGLAGDDAVKSITLTPARLLGLGDRLGSIERGKDASIIAVDGSILDLRANVKRIWIAGQEVSLESRHTRLYEKFKNRPRP